MTEAEWLACEDVHEMLRALRAQDSLWRWTTRRARLFACGCCRRAWHLLTEPAQRAAVEAAERYADKQLSRSDLVAAHQAAARIHLGVDSASHRPGGWSWGGKGGWDFIVQYSPQREMLCNPGGMAAARKPWGEPYFTANDVRALVHFRAGADAARGEQRAQCDLLRDVVGPAGPHPAVENAWLVANGGTIPNLAQGIYDERAFDQLPILADALEKGGCDDVDILAHLRGGGEHARGCWALDRVLGKE
jgi:hypothetical protein